MLYVGLDIHDKRIAICVLAGRHPWPEAPLGIQSLGS
jgi:hypothetical protein